MLTPSKPVSAVSFTGRTFDIRAAHDFIASSTTGRVDVIVAPPGQGKSTATRQAVAKAIKRGTLRRVLWSTQSIVGGSALGEEALDDFTTLGVTASIVYGRANYDKQFPSGKFADQFSWGTEPEVKIISHARISRVFGEDNPTSAGLLGADLLVIDEDPTSSLLFASPTQRADDMRAYSLQRLAEGRDPVCAALVAVAADSIRTVAPRAFALRNGYIKGHGLYAEKFWDLFLHHHPGPVDIASFAASLQDGGIEQSEFVAQSFAEDAQLAGTHPALYRSRFGVHWPGTGFIGNPEATALLRFNLKPALAFDVPVLVLDGYAHSELYTALFGAVVVHEFARGKKLDVECSRFLHLDPLQDHRGDALANRQQIAQELAEQRRIQQGGDPMSKQLTIVNQVLVNNASTWQRLLKEAYGHLGLTVDTELNQMYWHSGRGRNAFAGADVYALNLPSLSSMHRDYSLSALFPDDPAQREELQAHATGAELLQMLNRGRQPTSITPRVPRIVVADSVSEVRRLLGDLADRADLREYVPILNFTKHSQNPSWRDMTSDLARELLAHFPAGLPKRVLEGLPRHRRRRQETYNWLKALAASAPVNSHLYRAYHDEVAWLYDHVQPGGTGNDGRLLNEAMAQVELTPMSHTKGQGQPLMYVPPGGSAEMAWKRYTALVHPVKWPDF
jgi:hypothetical protein